uniref:K Homology domain-containing protein n=1 Tax=Trichuris muris TaxID=70415 RepID=A0A5S6QI11_TRIMR
MATSEAPDEILVDQLSQLIEQIGVIGRCDNFDYTSKYHVSLLVCKAAELGNGILLLPLELRLKMLKYLRRIKKKHANCMDVTMHRRISGIMVATAVLSAQTEDSNDGAGSEEAKCSSEITRTDRLTNKLLKEIVATEPEWKVRSDAMQKLLETCTLNYNASNPQNAMNQKVNTGDTEVGNGNHSAEENEGNPQSSCAFAAANTSEKVEAKNEKATTDEVAKSQEKGSLKNANEISEKTTEADPAQGEMGTSPEDLFHVLPAECMFAAEGSGQRFFKREIIIPKSLSGLVFGCGEEVAAMTEILTNTVISFKPSEEQESWQRIAIAGRYKPDVDNTICFIHFLLKYRIKLDFAQLASLCCKFRMAKKQKRKTFNNNGKSYRSQGPASAASRNQGGRTLIASKNNPRFGTTNNAVSCSGPLTAQDDSKQQLRTMRTELEIPNDSVGKIMGSRGCIAAIIENLTNAVVSFQRTVVGNEKRMLHLKAQCQQDLNCVKELVMLTLEHGIRFGLLTDVLFWGKECLQYRSFQDLADNMSALPNWETLKTKCYHDVWMPEGRRSIRQLLLKNGRCLKGAYEKSINLHLPSTVSMEEVNVAKESVSEQRKNSPSSSSVKTADAKEAEKEATEKDEQSKSREHEDQERQSNLICRHDNELPALQRANFLMAALDRSSSSAMVDNCQLLCDVLGISKTTC